MPAPRRNVLKPPARVIRRGTRILQPAQGANWPAPAFATAATLAGAATSPALVPVPAGVEQNNVIVVVLYLEPAAATVTGLPSGFTEKTSVASANTRMRVFWKRATASDTGTYDFTLGGGATWREGHALRVTGCVQSGDPFDQTNTAFNDTASATSPAVSVTTSVIQTLLAWAATTFAGSDTWTGPTSFTVQTNLASAGTATLLQAAAGSSGSLTGTTNASSDMTAFVGALLAVAPAVSAATPQPVIAPSLATVQQASW